MQRYFGPLQPLVPPSDGHTWLVYVTLMDSASTNFTGSVGSHLYLPRSEEGGVHCCQLMVTSTPGSWLR